MASWRDINRDAWTFTPGLIVGAGGGIGEYKTAYALNLAGGSLLNGRIAANIRIATSGAAGAGLICRADSHWTFLSFYTAPVEANADYTLARIGIFRCGVFTPLAVLSEKIRLPEDYCRFTLEFHSGIIRGEIRTPDSVYELAAICPHIPFPGYAGLVKFYDGQVLAREILAEETDMPTSLMQSNRTTSFEYDLFLCHASADKPLVTELASRLKQEGITYWLDSERIGFGDPITAKIEEGLHKSRFIIPCMSANFAKSGWTRAEYGAILNAELSGDSTRVVIPLKLDDSADGTIRPLLRDKKRVTYANKTEFSAFLNFIKAR